MPMDELESLTYLHEAVKCVYQVGKHMQKRLLVEHYLIKELRKNYGKNSHTTFLNEEDFDLYPKQYSLLGVMGENVTKRTLGLARTKFDFHSKARYCIERDIFSDILQTIIEYGFDYDFFIRVAQKKFGAIFEERGTELYGTSLFEKWTEISTI